MLCVLMRTVNVFVQNQAGLTTKNRHDESTFEHVGSFELVEPYPFPYGFIPDTSAADGDCLDCYVLTRLKLVMGQMVQACPVGLLEQFENGEPDHKVLAVLPGEDEAITTDDEERLRAFVRAASLQFPAANFRVGRVLSKAHALELIRTSTVHGDDA